MLCQRKGTHILNNAIKLVEKKERGETHVQNDGIPFGGRISMAAGPFSLMKIRNYNDNTEMKNDRYILNLTKVKSKKRKKKTTTAQDSEGISPCGSNRIRLINH